MTEPLIRDVSDTAFWIAHLRALETGRADALFRDPLADRLAGDRGRNISATMPNPRIIGWNVAIRTCIIDDLIRSAIGEGVDTILNLGAGLDTRPYRMDLPAELRWIEADYPRIIEYKESLLAGERAHCRLERLKIDLSDRSARRQMLSRIDAQAGGILVLTEGVVPYLSVEQAASLADDVRGMHQARLWVVDYFSPEAMKFRLRAGMGRRMQNAPFKFAPGDWFGFFRQHGWHPRQLRYLADEGERLGRPIPLPWPMRAAMSVWKLFMPKDRRDELRKFAAYVLLEPG